MIVDLPSAPRLPAAWSWSLASALRTLVGNDDFVFGEDELGRAAGSLQRLPASQLLRLEESVRRSRNVYRSLELNNLLSGRKRQPISPWPTDRLPLGWLRNAGIERAEACLFVASCDHDGYLREYALRAFADWPGRLAMDAPWWQQLTPLSITEGYYFWNLRLREQDSGMRA